MRLLSLSMLLFITSAVAAAEIVEGEWELTVKQDLGGMTTGNPVMVYQECLTEASPIPKSFIEATDCDVKEQKTLHRSVRWKMSCHTSNGLIYNEGSISFYPLKVSGQSRSHAGDSLGRNTTIRYTFSGRRLGDCP